MSLHPERHFSQVLSTASRPSEKHNAVLGCATLHYAEAASRKLFNSTTKIEISRSRSYFHEFHHSRLERSSSTPLNT